MKPKEIAGELRLSSMKPMDVSQISSKYLRAAVESIIANGKAERVEEALARIDQHGL
jgi:hypothetical protein